VASLDDDRALVVPADEARAAVDDVRSHTLFVGSRSPMLIADDDRRLLDANAAACLFLRRSLTALRTLTIDDLTAPQLCAELVARWSDVLREGAARRDCRLTWELQLPGGERVAVALRGSPNVEPGRHLEVIVLPARRALDERLDRATQDDVLTRREREILTVVALGYTGRQIAEQLILSPATVATHVAAALAKLGARNRAHGIAIAVQTGLLDLGGSCPSAPSALAPPEQENP
jgi:DNA-binding CsgD family transcriptional regulator